MAQAHVDEAWAHTASVMSVVVSVAPYLSRELKQRMLSKIQAPLRKRGRERPRGRRLTLDDLAKDLIGE